MPHCLEFPDIPVLQDAITPFDFTDLNVPVDQTDLIEFMADHVLIDVKEAHALEKRTVLQLECAEWLEQHKYRLNASNFGKVYIRVQRPSESMLKSIFVPKDLSNVRAISHGKGKEKVARTIYAKKKCNRASQSFQYLMLGYRCTHPYLTSVQAPMEKCLIRQQKTNMDY